MATLPPWGRRARWLFGALLLVSLFVAIWDHQGRWHTPGAQWRHFAKLWLYWAVHLVGWLLPALWVSMWLSAKGLARLKLSLVFVLTVLGLWSSLIEPRWIAVRETTITGVPAQAQPLRLAVVADVHWGLFFRDHQLEALVEWLNAMDVDAVVVAGDWTYEPTLDLQTGLAPLARIRHPVWGVLGNHDVQAPGPDLTQALREALTQHGVRLLEGRVVPWKGWELVGLDDEWGGRPQAQIQALWPSGRVASAAPRLVVAHQPDTIEHLPAGAAFLSLSGHTHGGQIWIPGLTTWVLRHTSSPVHEWWNGLYDTPAGHLLVTPGIGMIGLPARLAVRPTIERIDLVH
ncbi:metallophosphoesterase [Hydrogenophaga sp.]|uniref:metallophosphoesterase n=1 Tax=Hydrogenophaga sp. TaxID=1904254 RepID=UPI0035B1DE61